MRVTKRFHYLVSTVFGRSVPIVCLNRASLRVNVGVQLLLIVHFKALLSASDKKKDMG